MSVSVQVLRVFTDEAGEHGNELGVVEQTDESRGREQAIAAELGFSETVFHEPIDGYAARARIFTPASELPFAGHPTVGLAWWLLTQGHPIRSLEVPAGAIDIETADGDVYVVARPEWAPEFAFVELGTPDDVDALDPDAAPEGATYYWAWLDRETGVIRSRMFAPSLGIREDQATGAGAVRLTALLGRDLEIRQGDGCLLRTRFQEDTVAVGGKTAADRVVTLR